MSTSLPPKPTALFVNAVCVAVDDLGITETPYGPKPTIKFTFEAEQRNEYGQKRRLTRLFHKHLHSKSALSIAAKAWCDRCLAAEEENCGEVDWQSFVETPAVLKLEPAATRDGRGFDKIVEILPLYDAAEEACEPKDNE